MSLYEHISNKNPNGLPFEDAKQLCLLLYCTLDPLPPSIRSNRIGRHELAKTFSRLAAAGEITGCKSLSAADLEPLHCNPSDVKFWNQLIDDLLHKKVILDIDFKNNRACHFL